MNALGAFVGSPSLAGLLRQARGQEWKPIHFIFVFYLAVVLLWNYPIMDRFLLLFLPFFIMGVWIEGKRLSGLVFAKLRSAGPVGERVLAGIAAAGLATLVVLMAWNCVVGYRPQLKSISAERSEDHATNTAGLRLDSRAYRTGSRHRGCGRHDSVPVYESPGRGPDRFFDRRICTREIAGRLERDLDHITDTAVALGACYWLTSQNDFEMLDFPTTEAQDRVAQLTAGLPQVSRSEDGRTRLYDASSLSHPLSPSSERCLRAAHRGRELDPPRIRCPRGAAILR